MTFEVLVHYTIEVGTQELKTADFFNGKINVQSFKNY